MESPVWVEKTIGNGGAQGRQVTTPRGAKKIENFISNIVETTIDFGSSTWNSNLTVSPSSLHAGS